MEKSKATEEEALTYLNLIIQKMHFFNEELISVENFFSAYRRCKDVDETDTTYIALDYELWTRDEELEAGLRLRGFDHETTHL